jgi:hypothetical protein
MQPLSRLNPRSKGRNIAVIITSTQIKPLLHLQGEIGNIFIPFTLILSLMGRGEITFFLF